MKCHIWNYFFENIISGIQLFIFAQMYQRPSSEFLFNFRFSSRKTQNQQKLGEKIAHFTIQFRSKNITHFTNLDSLDSLENNMLSQYSQKPFWLYKFSSRHVSAWCQIKHLHCNSSWRRRTAFLKYVESKCLYISVYIRKKIFFERRCNILFDGGGLGEDYSTLPHFVNFTLLPLMCYSLNYTEKL